MVCMKYRKPTFERPAQEGIQNVQPQKDDPPGPSSAEKVGYLLCLPLFALLPPVKK